MNFLIIFFISALSHKHSASGYDVFDYMHVKLKEFSSGVVTTFNDIVGKLKNVFVRSIPYVDRSIKIEQYISEEKIKQSFNDVVEKTAASSEYFNLSSEPTALMSTPQLATLHGKRVESYVITTKDGYLLTLHRLFNTSNDLNLDKTVLLHHGLLGSSADWILLGPEKSLPYILNNDGYDVWMANARGNYYSRGHITKRVNSSNFWQFSFQEMGEFDLTAIIDFIRRIKNSTKEIDFVGHSMGATALLVMLSTNPIYNNYLRIGVLLAPLAYMSNIQGPLQLLTSMSNRPPEHLLKIIGDSEFLPSRRVPKIMATKFCSGPKIYCSNPLLFLAGNIHKDETLDESFVARLLYHAPAGTSTNTIMHYGQLVQNGRFHRFGQPFSEFPLHRVKLPIVFITSTEDWLATVPDVMRLYFSVANPIDHLVIRGKKISHTEFVWGSNSNELVFTKVLEFLTRNGSYSKDKENEV